MDCPQGTIHGGQWRPGGLAEKGLSYMCIMEVRPGQRATTIAPAMAHNVSTAERDLEMFRALLTARRDRGDQHAADVLDQIEQAQDHLHRAYAGLLSVFGQVVGRDSMDAAGHVHIDSTGHERTLIEQAHHDAQLARRYETR